MMVTCDNGVRGNRSRCAIEIDRRCQSALGQRDPLVIPRADHIDRANQCVAELVARSADRTAKVERGVLREVVSSDLL